MSNLSDDESMYSTSATVANSDIIPVVRASTFTNDLEEQIEVDDGEFDPSVEEMVHDFDDEKTIEEEEKRALEENEEFQREEVESLQKESEMPLEELMKMYSTPPVIESPKNRNRKPSEESDGEFEPSVEMMVHDFDDEITIEEEEKRALEDDESFQHEVESLQKESEMPLEELMKMYSTPETSKVKKKKSKVESALQRSKKARKRAAAASSQGANLQTRENEPIVPVSSTTQDIPEAPEPQTEEEEEDLSLLATIAVEEDVEDEEDDGDYSPEDETVDTQDPDDEDTKKVKIGFDYQANIPDGLCKYDDVLPYNNEDKLVWCPFAIDDRSIETYLDNYREIDKIQQQQLENEKKEKEKRMKDGGESPSDDKNLPTSTTEDILETVQLTYDSSKHQHLRSSTAQNLRDDEQALFLLLQCGFNFEEALRRKKVNNGICCSFPFSSPMSSWSEEECRSFENGMRLNGKNFYIIAKTKTTTRSVSEICEFYYNWKKTTRYDAFVSKQNGNGSEDKKIVNNFRKNNSSVTDYMDKFLDEDSSASDTLLNGDGSEKTLNLRKRRGSSANSDNNNDRPKRSEGSRTSGRTTLLPKK
ncbi:MIER3 family protein [Megaselia abdita]